MTALEKSLKFQVGDSGPLAPKSHLPTGQSCSNSPHELKSCISVSGMEGQNQKAHFVTYNEKYKLELTHHWHTKLHFQRVLRRKGCGCPHGSRGGRGWHWELGSWISSAASPAPRTRCGCSWAQGPVLAPPSRAGAVRASQPLLCRYASGRPTPLPHTHTLPCTLILSFFLGVLASSITLLGSLSLEAAGTDSDSACC